ECFELTLQLTKRMLSWNQYCHRGICSFRNVQRDDDRRFSAYHQFEQRGQPTANEWNTEQQHRFRHMDPDRRHLWLHWFGDVRDEQVVKTRALLPVGVDVRPASSCRP